MLKLVNIKKTILIISVACFTGHFSFGQDYFKIGLIGGATGSQVHGDGLSGYHKLGLHIGAWVEHQLDEKWSIGFELSYAQKGSKKNPSPDNGDYTSYKMHLEYVEVPIIAKYYLNKFFFEGGLGFNFLTKAEESNEIGLLPTYPPFKKFELAFIGGLGYTISDKLKISLRTSNSIIPIKLSFPGQKLFSYNGGGKFNSVLYTTFHFSF